MPYSLLVPANLSNWSIKIYDKERLEPPHITVNNGECTWRINLRTKEFMDPAQPGCKLHKQVKKLILDNWTWLVEEWDKRYPNNQVAPKEKDDED